MCERRKLSPETEQQINEAISRGETAMLNPGYAIIIGPPPSDEEKARRIAPSIKIIVEDPPMIDALLDNA